MKKPAILTRTSKYINQRWLLKVSGVDQNGNRIHKLVGVAGMLALIGIEMFNKLLARAEKCLEDVCVCKLRRGLKISFYVK